MQCSEEWLQEERMQGLWRPRLRKRRRKVAAAGPGSKVMGLEGSQAGSHGILKMCVRSVDMKPSEDTELSNGV